MTVKLDKLTSFNYIEIWQPRWHDRKVLIAKHKVGQHNKVVFTKAPTLEGEYYISGTEVKKYKLEHNGTISCYAVPLDKLDKLELTENSQFSLW